MARSVREGGCMKGLRPGGRGSGLLLDHCARLERLTASGGRSARERLEAELGDELTRVLLGSLCRSASGQPIRA